MYVVFVESVARGTRRPIMITDRLHHPNDSAATREQHPRCDLDGFVGEILITYRHLTCREKASGVDRQDQVHYMSVEFAAYLGFRSMQKWTRSASSR